MTPKGETQLTPEEKLLRAIFGEKAGDVRDASLKVPPGIEGTIVDVKIFSRKGVEKDTRAKEIEQSEIGRLEKNIKDEVRILTEERNKKVRDLLVSKKVTAAVKSRTGQELLKAGDPIGEATLERLTRQEILRLPVDERRRSMPSRSSTRRRIRTSRSCTGSTRSASGSSRRATSSAGRHQAGQGLRRHEAQAAGGRQDGRPAR